MKTIHPVILRSEATKNLSPSPSLRRLLSLRATTRNPPQSRLGARLLLRNLAGQEPVIPAPLCHSEAASEPKNLSHMRSGFSFVTAIMMMLLISVVGMAMLQLSNMSVEQKGQAFMKTQAELLARSATEYAIKDMLFNPGSMPSTQTDLNGGKTIEINASVYNITMEIQFMGAPDTLSANPDDRKYYGTMLVDTTVATTIDGMPIRYVRRTVQRP